MNLSLLEVNSKTSRILLRPFRFGLLPHRKAIHVVVGSPIEVKRVESPTNEEIESMHKKYVEELRRLYEKYNPIYGDKEVKLVIE